MAKRTSGAKTEHRKGMIRVEDQKRHSSADTVIEYSKHVDDADIFFADVTIDHDYIMRRVLLCKGRKNIASKIRHRYGKDFSHLYINVTKVTGTAIL